MTITSFTQRDISMFTNDEVADLAARLERDEYSDPFEALQDWHLLRAIAFQRQELAEPYLYLLDLEAYDEA
jgi:hypothetical protein